MDKHLFTGRTGPGVCYRLFSEDEYADLEQYSAPEIKRVPLDSLLLQMVAMGLPDARKFPFIEPPPSESIENSIMSLKQQVYNIQDLYIFVFVLMGWSLLPNALQPFQTYCAHPNLGITKT